MLGHIQVSHEHESLEYQRMVFSTARQLPCGHCFHGSCLRLWLEQDATCPTCRRKLNHEEEVDEGGETENDDQAQPQPVWQFNLRRISRWLPSLQGLFSY